jgi:hypothetical protein
MQAGLRVGLVPGYRIVFRYDDSAFCKDYDETTAVNKQQKICGFVAPLATEIALSFAPLDSFEPYLFGRFGLSGEAETNTEPLRVFGLGARIYTMADSRFKIFVEPALALELEDGAGNPDYSPALPMGGNFKPKYGTDFIFHLGIGPQFDVAKAVGFYLNVGMDVGILRAIHSTLLGNIGIQVRAP